MDVRVNVYDTYREETFNLKAILLSTINDFPTYENLSGCTVKGYKASPICGHGTHYKRLPHGPKCYYGGHRKFLPADQRFRK